LLYSLKCRNFNNQMYFMTITDEIIIIANQLANQGKKPTVALIKTKLTKSVPLPTIITTLKGWSHDPDLITFNKSELNTNIEKNRSISFDPEVFKAINQAVEQAIKPLKVELAQLKAQLADTTK